MGRVSIPLRPLSDKLWHQHRYQLTNENGDLDKPRGELELGVWWMHSTETAARTAMDLSDAVEV